MKNCENRWELLRSLFFPVITLLWGVSYLVNDYINAGGNEAFSGLRVLFLFPYIAGILGGILSISFTLFLRINTSRYFLKRLIVLGIIFVIYQVMMMTFLSVYFIATVFIAAGVAGVIYQILKIQDEDTTPKERAVLLLSDPIIYWIVFWLVSCIIIR